MYFLLYHFPFVCRVNCLFSSCLFENETITAFRTIKIFEGRETTRIRMDGLWTELLPSHNIGVEIFWTLISIIQTRHDEAGVGNDGSYGQFRRKGSLAPKD